MVTSLAGGLRSFTLCRFALGLGESGNWPGATKAVAEWFPKRERGWAVALFDSGSSVGAAVAPFLVLFLYQHFGTWRPAFLLTGTLGFIWLGLWLWSYHPPETHPRIGEAERSMILQDKKESGAQDSGPIPSWSQLLKLPQTWGVILGKSLTDPIWFFVTDWFAVYLVSKKISIQEGVLAFWIPFVAADLGNFFGGGLSSWLIQRGWPVGRARKAVIVGGGVGMAMLAPAVLTSNVWLLAGLFGISTFAYAAWSTMGLVLPSDLYPSGAVASVSGMSGTGAGFGTILSTYLIGKIADRYSFEPILIAASLIPLVATAAVLLLVRNNRACDTGLVRRI
jgi:ACS family hexuronate transporter-like MFS transporter